MSQKTPYTFTSVVLKNVPITIDFSWFVLLLLTTWSLSVAVLPPLVPTLSLGQAWEYGVGISLLFFLSIFFHELAHVVMANRYKVPVSRIAFSLLGGETEFRSDPPNPQSEFFIALSGPLVSLILAFVFSMATFILNQFEPQSMAIEITSLLAELNWLIGGFNLIPCFPLDGGRMVRAMIWRQRSDLVQATQFAALLGVVLAVGLILTGLFYSFMNSTTPLGVEVGIVGLFLLVATRQASKSFQTHTRLRTLDASNVMDKLRTQPPNLTLSKPTRLAISPTLSLDRVLQIMVMHEATNLPVVRKNKTIGFISRHNIVRYIRRHNITA